MDEKKIYQELRQRFGFTEFRDGQLATIKAIMGGHNTLAVLPTGGGKSLLYQLPGYLMAETVLVVSPLISLMQDQVDRLHRRGEKGAIMLTGQVYGADRQRLLQNLANYKFIFASPELLTNQAVVKALQRVQISLLTIDEAHCISQWGPDFRPEYLMLKQLRQVLGDPVTLMLTATATPAVRRDIIQKVGLVGDQVVTVKRSVNRPNIFLAVDQCQNGEEKRARLLQMVTQLGGAGIIYFSSRRLANEMANWLNTQTKIGVASYHAGMSSADRFRIQQQFMNDQVKLICATSAFGMGIDKENIRFVIHYHLPDSLENYVQEIGRAGRDGKQSAAVILYAPGDEQLPRQLLTVDLPPADLMQAVQRGKVDEKALGPDYQLFSFYLKHHFTPAQVELAFTRRKKRRLAQLQVMTNYVQSAECRRNFILRYFDESATTQERCCDHELADWLETGILAKRVPPSLKSPSFDWHCRLASLLNLVKN
ncbi:MULTISPECIES: RecQ family ATP-dependent DNA helicase [Limosilactobacillus]|uniref:ATP-dependent DNA helicase RecQ n=1 Tax=Limosilactobacillus panis DSM 6035 TaxID=1423782 RepID=A0A0R1XA92_9LACO|nr:ATP-dependent DNA helicase RecQ [Limosilactobacillus panis]KRM25003.1 atp-dependent dna helicase, recq family [Limosilactobacillus panis DSM 6035]